MRNLYTRYARIRVGRVRVTLEIAEGDAQGLALAEDHLRRLSELLQGLATDEEAALSAKILNGPTMDSILGRKGARPCGCRGKK